MAEELPEGWIKHDGGPCPVDPVSRPLMMFAMPTPPHIWNASGAIHRNRKWRAGAAVWSNCIAYKPEEHDHG